jgi:hemoglobin/transferrin/lactoferrin receptor protein
MFFMPLRFMIFFLLFSVIVHAQTVIIKDKNSMEPLGGVVLLSNRPYEYTTTNAKGQTNISEFSQSNNIEISSLGYVTQVLTYEEIKKLDYKILLEPATLNMDEVILSATKWKQHADDSPALITSLNKKNTILQNPQTAADLLATSGKVFIQKSQQGGGSPMIRGFATNRLLYSIDGVRMNTAIFRSGNIQNVISLDPFAIEKTEVVFGPGSVIYGSDAVGGVMSFTSLTPHFSLSEETLINGKAILRYSSANNEKTAHFDTNVGWKKWALTSSLSYVDYDDLTMGSHGPDEYLRTFYVQTIGGSDVVIANKNPQKQVPSGYSQTNFMQKVHFKPNDNWDTQFGFHYSETSDYDRYDRLIRMRDGLPRDAEWYYGPQKWRMGLLDISHQGNNKLYDELEIRAAYQFFEESRISRGFNSTNRKIRTEQVDAYSVNLDFVNANTKTNKIFYGLEWVYNDVTSLGVDENTASNTSQEGPTRYPQAGWTSLAAYITDQFKFSDNARLQGGLRYNFYKIDAIFDTTFYPFPFTKAQNKNGALTGNLGIVYKPTKNFVLSANAATAFRSPNIDDIGKVFDSGEGIVVVPNPNLKAEYAYNLDLGMAFMLHKIFKMDITGYYTYLDNAMVRRDFSIGEETYIMYDGELSQVQALQNAAFARVYGLQAGIEVKLPNGFGVSGDYNIQEGKEELDNGKNSPTRHAPPAFGNLEVSYSKEGLNMQVYTHFSGEKSFDKMPLEEISKSYLYAQDSNGNPYSPSWYTLNFKANYQLNKTFNIGAGLENITDQRYRSYSSGISAPGRNFIMSLKAQY